MCLSASHVVTRIVCQVPLPELKALVGSGGDRAGERCGDQRAPAGLPAAQQTLALHPVSGLVRGLFQQVEVG